MIMILLKNILVATDFGEASDAALSYGRDLARTYGATLHVLHVAENLVVRYADDGALALLPQLQTDIDEAARKRMAELVTDEDRTMLHATPVVLAAFGTAEAIIEYAKMYNGDVIGMGTHGRGGFAHLLMGSVAERVVRTAPCPVLTVRHPEHEFIVPDALVAVARG
jgi:nucleotide-binding universal stress UspA family protein